MKKFKIAVLIALGMVVFLIIEFILISMFISMDGPYQELSSLCSLITALMALYTVYLNKKSSERMEVQIKQAEKDKHAAVQPLLFINNIGQRDNTMFGIFIQSKTIQTYTIFDAEWIGESIPKITIKPDLKAHSDFIQYKITFEFDDSEFPVSGKIRVFILDMYGGKTTKIIPKKIMFDGKYESIKELQDIVII
ncbi:MAG: hypothetical protein ABF969_04145 [Sporolactobacillus sp.]